jgi:glycosyl transferase family 25
MDRIDKFIYINLKKRIDRKNHILKQLKNYAISDSKIERFEAVENEKGALGCAYSHLGVAEKFKNEAGPNEVWCILEDDHYFTQTKEFTDNYINEFLDNKNFDVFLGCTAKLRGNPVFGGKFLRAYKSNMTSFFIIKRNVADALVASHKQSIRSLRIFPKKKKDGIPIDVMWHNLMKVFFFVTSYCKVLGGQLDGYSDILNKNKNYSNIIGVSMDKIEDLEKDKIT